MDYFLITTNRNTATEIERFFKSVASINRSIKLGKVEHHPSMAGSEEGYSTVQVLRSESNNPIDPADIFWMGYFTAFGKYSPTQNLKFNTKN